MTQKFLEKSNISMRDNHETIQDNVSQTNEEQEKQIRNLINKKLKSQYPVRERYSIWDAIVAWRDFILSSSFLRVTKTNYLSRIQKLIEAEIINPALKLSSINKSWLKECIDKIDLHFWTKTTKVSIKTCLTSFYKFSQQSFDPDYTDEYERLSYGYIPTPHEIKHRLCPTPYQIEKAKKLVLSSVQERELASQLDILKLYQLIRRNNERDALIIATILETGCTLEEVLDIKKCDVSSVYIQIKKFQYPVQISLIAALEKLYKESSEYVFTTSKGKRVGRIQVTRNLKKAGREIGLNFDLTPMIFHRVINAILLRDKRSSFEKLLSD